MVFCMFTRPGGQLLIDIHWDPTWAFHSDLQTSMRLWHPEMSR